jgi:hypothetical protein
MRARDKDRQIHQIIEVRRLLKQTRQMEAARVQAIAVGLEQARDEQVEQLVADQRSWRQSIEATSIALQLAPFWQSRFRISELALKDTDRELAEACRAVNAANASLATAAAALGAANTLARVSRAGLQRHTDERLLNDIADFQLQRRRAI